MLIDCHTHVSARDLASGEFRRMLDRCAAMGVGAIVVSLVWEGGRLEVAPEAVLAAAAGHPVRVCIAMGFEPPSRWAHVAGLDEFLPNALAAARDAAQAGMLCGIGEVGLDRYWPLVGFLSDTNAGARDEIDRLIDERRDELLGEPNVRQRLAAQRTAFQQWIDVAIEFNLPLVVHERDACEQAFEILDRSGVAPDRVMLHCFSAGVQRMRAALGLGYWISLPASMTYRPPYVEQARAIDLARTLIETDAPYQTPIKGLWKRALDWARAEAEKHELSRKARDKWIKEEKERMFAILVEEYLPGLAFELPGKSTLPAAEHFQSSRHRNVNEAAFVRCAAVELAKLQGVDYRSVRDATSRNAAALFGL